MADEKDEKARLLEAMGVDDIRLLERRARFAGWDLARFRRELESPGFRERFAADMARGVAADLDRRIDRRMREQLRGGPLALAETPLLTLASYIKDARLAAAAMNYNPFEMGGRLVCGPTGTGKSVTGIATLRRMHGLKRVDMDLLYDPDERTHSTGWVRAYDLPNARLSHGLGSGEAPLVSEAMSVDFLVLDDVGWESKRAGADDVVVEVIATRYDAGRITYATSGLKLDDFENRYGSAVVRRLTESRGHRGRVLNVWSEAK